MSSLAFRDSTFSGFSSCLGFGGATCKKIRAIDASFGINVACAGFTIPQLASGFLSISVCRGCFCIIGLVFHNHGSTANAILPNRPIFAADF